MTLTLINPPPVCARCRHGEHWRCHGFVAVFGERPTDVTYRQCSCCGPTTTEVPW